ncbi:hypothetical protein DUNSADRAFT_4901 [Dunaliella salina]|uniref:Uncharacterized protein n=1 Tax=Dunaliella salina TaxID=3046 RepID=A0ABQ7GR68_DUNSA|nr:hypothetical protein DUNSADRAFT_4901 [Dunaliella salina]|eukprot:KAF5837068.1 hypothetical protein DUNSADRAFT_4901 [Dunaliella salina]
MFTTGAYTQIVAGKHLGCLEGSGPFEKNTKIWKHI